MPDGNQERALVERAKRDPKAFGELYECYVDRIYNYIYHRTGNVHDAEDLTSRTFFRAMRGLERYEYKGVPFSAWLYRIAHNLVANHHRDRGRHKLVFLDQLTSLIEKRAGPEHQLETLADQEWVRAIIEKLHPDRQTLLILKFSEELSNAEIGQIMGRSEGAIKSLYHRTLVSLRKELKIDLEED